MGPGPQTLERNQPRPPQRGGPDVDDLLIKEAKRRRRRRRLWIAAVSAVFASVIGLGISSLTSGSAHRTDTKRESSRPPSASGAGPVPCSPSQLTASVAFDQTGTDLGAITLSNAGAHPCALSGQPKVVVFDGSGAALSLEETVLQRAGLPAAPIHPIVLSADRRVPQAIVAFDWTWCGGPPPGALRFSVAFAQWHSALMIPNSGIAPAGFAPADCAYSGDHSLFAVDDVRGFGHDGIEAASS
jgi:Protein of unknown function (DUF4232)